MSSQEIRRQFLSYFKEKKHCVVPSSAVIPQDDPTLLFINAGMNQFKDVFLGNTVRDYTRAASSQKCIRAGGKHNDLDNVGHTSRHLTFFEMLGNFSFGDYFKEEAIRFAWEVTTEVFQFDPEKIWPTVYTDDDEAFELWTKYVPAKKITRFGKEENFWEMGETGPCGPCSELLYDKGAAFGSAPIPAEDKTGERFLEFWNLVFMQYNRDEEGTPHPLPKPSIDTGAGLERVVDLKIGAKNVFETDILRSLIAEVENRSNIAYDPMNQKLAPAFHVIADHLRTLAFAIADGAHPSNVDRGYVLRKILRRAVRYGRQLKFEAPFLANILPRLIDTMGKDYPELTQAKESISSTLTSEEEAFFRTLKRGGNLLNQVIFQAEKEKRPISGDEAFKLKDTYGFPIEEILLIATDSDLTIDLHTYEKLELEAKERSKKAHRTVKQIAKESLFANYLEKNPPTQFLGYTKSQSLATVTALVHKDTFVDTLNNEEEGWVILDKTPFYAEQGGQVGDTGTLTTEKTEITITDCQSPYKGVTAHRATIVKGPLKVGEQVTATIAIKNRQKIANNHTATHLLHWALRKILGNHVKQAGSVVAPDRLRFDFCHHKALTQDEIFAIEQRVNEKIRENLPVNTYEMAYEEVQGQSDIMQFFGEKYDQKVRVIDIDFSKELCGGTHTDKIGNIGYFRIAKEASIAAGIRRIEAVTGDEALHIDHEQARLIQHTSELLKTSPNKLLERVTKLLEENQQQAKALKAHKKSELTTFKEQLKAGLSVVNDIPLIAQEVKLSSQEMRELADDIAQSIPSCLLLLAAKEGGRAHLQLRITEDLVARGLKAHELIRELAPLIEGGGGGKAMSAQAGGKAPEKIALALDKIRELTHASSK